MSVHTHYLDTFNFVKERALVNPFCRQIESAEDLVKPFSHTNDHLPLTYTCNIPYDGVCIPGREGLAIIDT